MVHQGLARFIQELLQRLAFLDLKEVLIEIRVSHIIKSQVRWEVLRGEKLLCGANLIEKLSEHLIVLKNSWDFETLNSKAFVTAVGKLLDDTALIQLQHSDWLLTVVDMPDSSGIELPLKSSFLLFDDIMWELDGLETQAIYLVPYKSIHIFTLYLDIFVDLIDCLLTLQTLLITLIHQCRKLLQFCPL